MDTVTGMIKKIFTPVKEKISGSHDSPFPYRQQNYSDQFNYEIDHNLLWKVDGSGECQSNPWKTNQTTEAGINFVQLTNTNGQAALVDLPQQDEFGEYRQRILMVNLYGEKGYGGIGEGNTSGIQVGYLPSIVYQMLYRQGIKEGDLRKHTIEMLDYARKMEEIRACLLTNDFSESKIEHDSRPTTAEMLSKHPDMLEIENQFLKKLCLATEKYYHPNTKVEINNDSKPLNDEEVNVMNKALENHRILQALKNITLTKN